MAKINLNGFVALGIFTRKTINAGSDDDFNTKKGKTKERYLLFELIVFLKFFFVHKKVRKHCCAL